jgi:hypothetical protein
MVTRTIDRQPEPRLQVGRAGVPFFGRDVERLQPEKIVSIDASDLGTPIDSINDIPPGDYFVQAVVVVYSEFRRADGHVSGCTTISGKGSAGTDRRARSTATSRRSTSTRTAAMW